MAATREILEWPTSDSIYLTLDLECDYGTALRENSYEAVEHVEKLIGVIDRHDVSITCFVQTELFDTRPDAVEQFRDSDATVEFYPHSHTHKLRSETSIEEEVAASTTRFQEFFGVDPIGYRFPNGDVRPEDYEILAEHGYAFDASVFPSWRPGQFDNTDLPSSPFIDTESDIVELPFTVLSDRLRIPVSLSYLKFLGRPFSSLVYARPPPTIVFDLHMHDIVVPKTFGDLPLRYRAVYARRKYDGLAVLDGFISTMKERGYQFDVMSSLFEETAGTGGASPA